MSYRLYFDLSTGLSADMVVPKGTLASIWTHIEIMERRLGLKRVPDYVPEGKEATGAWSWREAAKNMIEHAGPKPSHDEPQWWLADREREARINEMHALVFNGHWHFVTTMYENLGKWSKGCDAAETEVLKAEESHLWWGALHSLPWPDELMTRDVYRAYLEHVGEVLSGNESRGVKLDCKPLSHDQKEALLVFIEGETDVKGYDLRAAFPVDESGEAFGCVAFSYDGGYDWCGRCGLPIHEEAVSRRCEVCPKRKKKGGCELRNERAE